jgi:serine phosphatase RsbU (regulator of sigma subunit)/PAS domain-containing protein/anti-sigma regulatory factor (Ser/Thr protein kinase)
MPGTEHGLDERFRRALDSILDLVVVESAIRDDAGVIVDFEIVWMNNAPVDVAGRSRDRMIGRRISELYPVLAGGELIAGYRNVVETGEPMVVPVLPYEDVIDGREVSGFYTVQATRFEDGVLVASRDITALESSRRDLEVALRELEAAQRLARLGTWRIDLVREMAELSIELRRIFGLPSDARGEVALASMADRIHPEDRESVEATQQNAIRTGRSGVIDHRVLRVDGSVVHVRTYSEPQVADGHVIGLWGTTQDMSDAIATRDAFEAEHLRRVSAERLAQLASTLTGARGPQEVVDAVFRSRDHFADLDEVVLGIVENDESVLHQYFAGTSLSVDIRARYMRTPLDVDTYLTRAFNQDRPLFLGDRAQQLQAFPALAKDVDASPLESMAVMPLRRASGAVFGALAVGWAEPRRYEPDAVVMLQDIAAVVARAAERLELIDLERSMARTLQLGLLALDVRSTRAIVRARYRASDAAMEIGGDWYDAVELDDGRLAVAVGDVVGRGLPAATTMGQLRAALGITAMQADDAADAISILDTYAKHVPGATCATVAFAVVDVENETVSYASAGHPPPLLVTPDGHVRYLEGARSWPLGIDSYRARPPAAVDDLPAGSLLLLYTDGLIERRRESIDVGFERLRALVAANWSLPLRRLKQAIFSALVDNAGAAATDDVALVAVRTTGTSPTLFVDAFHAVSSEATAARHRLRDWLVDIGADVATRDALVLSVGEAVANAIDHGSHQDGTQTVKLEIAVRADDIIASVSDSGVWQPGIDGFFKGRGRGHLVMEGLTDDVDIDTDQQGTVVTLQMARSARTG